MLDEYPLDAISPETYYNNADELRSATNQFYGMFSRCGFGIYRIGRCRLHIQSTGRSTGHTHRTHIWRRLELGIPQSGQFLSKPLGALRRCRCKRTFRRYSPLFQSIFLFRKVKRFGEVPWFDRELSSTDPELFRPRDSRDIIMDKILDDLTYAINNISDKKDLYNVTHWTALALKSRICLFEGTFRKYHGIPGYEKFLNECATASKLFIDNAPYAIYQTGAQPYRDLFSSMNAIEEEVILARDYDRSQKCLCTRQTQTHCPPTYGRPRHEQENRKQLPHDQR